MEDELALSLDGKNLGNLRVVDLKQELDKRGLSKSGSKKDLVKRLKQQLEFEKLCEERKSTGDCDLKKELDAATEQNEFVQRYLAQQQKIYAEQKEMKRLVELEEYQKRSETSEELASPECDDRKQHAFEEDNKSSETESDSDERTTQNANDESSLKDSSSDCTATMKKEIKISIKYQTDEKVIVGINPVQIEGITSFKENEASVDGRIDKSEDELSDSVVKEEKEITRERKANKKSILVISKPLNAEKVISCKESEGKEVEHSKCEPKSTKTYVTDEHKVLEKDVKIKFIKTDAVKDDDLNEKTLEKTSVKTDSGDNEYVSKSTSEDVIVDTDSVVDDYVHKSTTEVVAHGIDSVDTDCLTKSNSENVTVATDLVVKGNVNRRTPEIVAVRADSVDNDCLIKSTSENLTVKTDSDKNYASKSSLENSNVQTDSTVKDYVNQNTSGIAAVKTESVASDYASISTPGVVTVETDSTKDDKVNKCTSETVIVKTDSAENVNVIKSTSENVAVKTDLIKADYVHESISENMTVTANVIAGITVEEKSVAECVEVETGTVSEDKVCKTEIFSESEGEKLEIIVQNKSVVTANRCDEVVSDQNNEIVNTERTAQASNYKIQIDLNEIPVPTGQHESSESFQKESKIFLKASSLSHQQNIELTSEKSNKPIHQRETDIILPSSTETILSSTCVEKKESSMDTTVPYSLSDIQLPDSPSNIGMSSTKTVSKKDVLSHKIDSSNVDSQNNSDIEVQTNGVNLKEKSSDRRSKIKSKSDFSRLSNKPLTDDLKSNSRRVSKKTKIGKYDESEKDSAQKVEVGKVKEAKSKDKQKYKHSMDDLNSSGSEEKVDPVKVSNIRFMDKKSSSEDSSSEESSKSDESKDRKRKPRKSTSIKKPRRRRKTSSSSSQSSQSQESTPKRKSAVIDKPFKESIKSDGEIDDSHRESAMSEGEIDDSHTETDDKPKRATSPEKFSLNIRSSSTITDSRLPVSSEVPRKKLKINRNNVVIPAISSTAMVISPDESPPSEKQSDVKPASPTQESSDLVEREVGEIIENLPEMKYENRKLNFPGRKLSHKSTDEQPSDESKSKKSKWGRFASSQKSSQVINISTDSLKNWFPDFKLVNDPVPLSECIAEESPPVKIEKKPKFAMDTENKTEEKQLAASTNVLRSNDESPAKNTEPSGPVSKVLFVQNLVRPFTLLQLKELLKQTGKLIEEEFWIDKIKSKCFATYETEAEAIKTRNALNGTRWPTSNPKILNVEFSTEEELEIYRTGGDIPKPPIPDSLPQVEDTYEPKIPQSSSENRKRDRETEKKRDRDRYRLQAPVREWDKDKISQESPDRNIVRKELEGFRASDRKEKKDAKKRSNEDTPAKLLDDLFQKTKSTPCIYWLPLTDALVAEREEAKRVRKLEREKRNQQREQEESEYRNKRPRSDHKSREAESRRSSTRSRSPTSRRR